MPEISVIVPTFKTAKYLPKCLDSILNQTFQDFEIIIVSDGPNEDHKIADEYAKKDNRITVLKDIKKDLGGARNAGIKIAKGKYFCSIDSDDWIEPTYLEKMYKAITSAEDVDIVQCGTEIVFEIAVDKNLWKNDEAYFAIRNDGIIDCDDLIFGTINVGTWNKLYKKELVDKYNIQFPENLRNEDAYFTWAYWMVSRKMYCIKEHLYNYLRRDDSLMAQTFKKGLGDKVLDHLKVGSLLYDFLIKNDLFEKRKYAFWRAFVICWCFVRDNGDEDVVKKAKKYVKNFFKGGVEPKVEPELMNIIAPNKMKFKKIISNIFSIKNSNDKRYKVVTVLGLKMKFKSKVKPKTIFDNGENNSIYIIDEQGVKSKLTSDYIEGFIVKFSGNNNTIILHEPLKFSECFFDIKSDNSYIEIGSSEWGINNLYAICVSGNNQKLKIGNIVFISGAKIFLSEENATVKIEDDCMLSFDIVIMPTDGHPVFDCVSENRINNITEVSIGKHCWIGAGTFIGKNVSIAPNNIIGAKSVATKSFDEEYTAIAGNPAKIVKRGITWGRNLKDKTLVDTKENANA